MQKLDSGQRSQQTQRGLLCCRLRCVRGHWL